VCTATKRQEHRPPQISSIRTHGATLHHLTNFRSIDHPSTMSKNSLPPSRGKPSFKFFTLAKPHASPRFSPYQQPRPSLHPVRKVRRIVGVPRVVPSMQQFRLLDGFDPSPRSRAHSHHVARSPLPSIRPGSAHPDFMSTGLTRSLPQRTSCSEFAARTLASRCLSS
jgi:hypothetical protein